jgi:hypothetical protein
VGGVFVRDCGGWPGAFLAGDGVGGWLGRQPGDGLRASFITCVRGVIDLRLAAVGPEPPPSAEIDLRLRALAEKPFAQPRTRLLPERGPVFAATKLPQPPSKKRGAQPGPCEDDRRSWLRAAWALVLFASVRGAIDLRLAALGPEPAPSPKSTYGSPPWPRNPSLRPETRPRVGDGAPAGRDRAREPSPGQEPLRTRPTAHGPRNASHTPASSFRNRHRTT